VVVKHWRSWLRVAQVAVTGVLLVWLFKQVDWTQLVPLFARLDWVSIALSVVLVLISHLINVARWRYMLHQRTVGYGELLAIYGAGLFSNNFLPTGVGGDGVRVGLLSRTTSLARAVVSVALDRGIALIALVAFVAPGFWLGLPPGLILDRGRIAASFTAGHIVLLVLILTEAALLGLALWQRPKLRDSLMRWLARWRGNTLWTETDWGRILGGGFLLSTLSHTSLIVAYYAVFQAVQVVVMPGAALWLYLVGSVSLLLPISVNGLGLQEGIVVALLVSYHVPTTDALGVALIIRVLIVLFSLIGGLLSLGLANPGRLGRSTARP
jgi:glycosyltransferase 2 family protein